MVVTKEQMDAAMNPKTVAVVGAKKDADYSWLKNSIFAEERNVLHN